MNLLKKISAGVGLALFFVVGSAFSVRDDVFSAGPPVCSNEVGHECDLIINKVEFVSNSKFEIEVENKGVGVVQNSNIDFTIRLESKNNSNGYVYLGALNPENTMSNPYKFHRTVDLDAFNQYVAEDQYTVTININTHEWEIESEPNAYDNNTYSFDIDTRLPGYDQIGGVAYPQNIFPDRYATVYEDENTLFKFEKGEVYLKDGTMVTNNLSHSFCIRPIDFSESESFCFTDQNIDTHTLEPHSISYLLEQKYFNIQKATDSRFLWFIKYVFILPDGTIHSIGSEKRVFSLKEKSSQSQDVEPILTPNHSNIFNSLTLTSFIDYFHHDITVGGKIYVRLYCSNLDCAGKIIEFKLINENGYSINEKIEAYNWGVEIPLFDEFNLSTGEIRRSIPSTRDFIQKGGNNKFYSVEIISIDGESAPITTLTNNSYSQKSVDTEFTVPNFNLDPFSNIVPANICSSIYKPVCLFNSLSDYATFQNRCKADQDLTYYKFEHSGACSTSKMQNLLWYSPTPTPEYEEEVITNQNVSAFTDLNVGTLENSAAAYLKKNNILGGYSDGEFKGWKAVNRAEIAKFLLKANKINIGNIQNNNTFYDVVDGEWYTKYVMKAYNLGILSGYDDGTFKPEKTVNTAEFLKLLANTFDIEYNLPYNYNDVYSYNWFSKYAGIAKKYNLFPDRNSQYLNPAKELTRKEVAIAIYNYLIY